MDDITIEIEVRLRTGMGREIRRRVTHSLQSIKLTPHAINATLDSVVASFDHEQVWRTEEWAERLLSGKG